MSVDIIYCEGGNNSADIRVLLNILSGCCTIRAAGSKYGLDRQILFIKKENLLPGSTVAALKDRDFDRDTSPPSHSPRQWTVHVNNQTLQVGWSWERKEIENYLIDPEVVSRALRSKAPPLEDYYTELKKSAQAIAGYTAARTALSLSRQQLLPLQNYWGSLGSGRHPFPGFISVQDCRDGIHRILQEHEQSQQISEDEVLATFEALLPTCADGGVRFQNFLTFFSGKDLLFGLRSALSNWQLGEPFVFRERVIKGIENSQEDVSAWIPEWTELRRIVQDFSP